MQALQAVERRAEALQSLPLAERRGCRLRIITGRGLHSSGGESSLPRVVQAFLDDKVATCGWRYMKHLGAVEVSLGRGSD